MSWKTTSAAITSETVVFIARTVVRPRVVVPSSVGSCTRPNTPTRRATTAPTVKAVSGMAMLFWAVGCAIGTGCSGPLWMGMPLRPTGQPGDPSYQRSTRRARSVFQRLGVPSPSSSAKWTAPGWVFSSNQVPSGCCLLRTSSIASSIRSSGASPAGAEVVERAQHVVVPARRERELQVAGDDDLAGALPPEQRPLEQVLLAAAPGLGGRRRDPPVPARTRAGPRAR